MWSMKIRCVAMLCSLTQVISACSQEPDNAADIYEVDGLEARQNPAAKTMLFTNAHWYIADDEGLRFEKGVRCQHLGIFIEDCPSDAAVVDLEGAYVVPGFGEAHNHSIDGPWTLETAGRYLEQGIYYYKNPNNVGPVTENFRSLWNKPNGLDVIFAHGGLSIDEGHPEKLYRRLAPNFRLDPEELDGQAFFNVETLELLEEKWPTILDGNPDFLKLYLLNHDDAERSAGLSEPVFRRAVEMAKDAGLRTTVHIETANDLSLAIEAGADEAAHMPGYWFDDGLNEDDYRISAKLAQRAAETGFIIIATVNVTEFVYDLRTESAEEKDIMKRRIKALQAENLQTLREAGVDIVIGSDTYMETARDEIQTLSEMNVFSDQELLQMWVETPSISIFRDRAIGKFLIGWEASFVALSCDPSQDITCTDKITYRVKQGIQL